MVPVPASVLTKRSILHPANQLKAFATESCCVEAGKCANEWRLPVVRQKYRNLSAWVVTSVSGHRLIWKRRTRRVEICHLFTCTFSPLPKSPLSYVFERKKRSCYLSFPACYSRILIQVHAAIHPGVRVALLLRRPIHLIDRPVGGLLRLLRLHLGHVGPVL